MEAASFQSDFTRVGIALNGRRGHISCHLERKSGSRWAKGPAREGGASQQCGRRDHAGLCAGGGGGEVTGHRKGTKQPGRGPSARVPHLRLCSARVGSSPSESSEFAQRLLSRSLPTQFQDAPP